MRVETIYDNLELDGRDRQILEREIARLERRARTFPPELAHLRVRLAGHGEPHPKLVETRVSLATPARVLEARAESRDARAAIHEAFDELTRQLERLKADLRGERDWRRRERRERLRRRLKETGAPDLTAIEREVGREALEDALDRLSDRVRREMTIRITEGDVDPALADANDVIDQVIARAAESWSRRPEGAGLDAWLWSLARDEIRRLVAQSALRETTEDLERPVPVTPPEEWVSTLGAETLDFWQPDETLSLEDLVDDPTMPLPEEVSAREELGRRAARAICDLPAAWREPFLLVAVDGMPVEDVAWAVDRSPDEVREAVEQARRFLRERLRS
ncbi:MAG: hypothetical protein D6738_04765 [Acidobacteria bacterium]|nr:MAG: hypothetical protein D6738_04765 [Acidobacteriota bacterium]